MSIVDQIRSGGKLAQLFHSAVQHQERASRRILSLEIPAKVLQHLSEDAHQRVDEGTDSSPLRVLRQCGAGCSACCRMVQVDVTPVEAFAIAEHLRQNVASATLNQLCDRMEQQQQLRRENPGQRNLMPCVFLNAEGLCGVYDVRPLVCAGVFSLSRGACDSAAEQLDKQTIEIPLDLPAKTWTMGVSGGLQRALVEAGLDGNLYELSSAVLCILKSSNALSRWLDREDVFHDCICTDPHSWPRKKTRAIRIDSRHTPRPKLAKKKGKAKQRRRAS